MDARILPEAFEPSYWNVVFHPSRTRLTRTLLGQFDHVSAFAYVPGFRFWVLYDNQWGGTRISFVAHSNLIVPYIRDCTVVRFDRLYKPMVLLSRLGFYCVPAIKNLLGLACVAATPTALYRHLIANGGILLNGQCVTTAAAAARPVAATGTDASASAAC